ncbi:MAG: hypothetical protein IKP53_04155 [Candidatus Methanomethylophilaceae archaeon]|jgi:hypothetical protein|nr:hypothetical protein [Candidatus Methanomethylophilaceae archaeon]MBR7005807.1 hypothetical protein [Candidatus Methanomethylophilaceae archaeon]
MADDKSRPLLITIIAILYFIAGVLGVLAGILLLVGGAAVGELALGGMTGGILVVMGLINLVIAGGFWNGWKAIWYLAVIFGFISIILCVVGLFTTGGVSIVGLIIQALLLYYMFRPNVKEFFGI